MPPTLPLNRGRDAPPDPGHLVLCADDYALTEPTSRGILALAEAGRLSAVSCLAASPCWPEHAQWLRPLRDRIDIGLHLSLTELAPLTAMPELAPDGRAPRLGTLLVRAFTGRLPASEIARELERQVECFLAHWGAPPDFLDGHQHVHVLPGVQDTTLALWERHLKAAGGYVRSCRESPGAILRRGVCRPKTLFIAALATPFDRRARRRGIPHNDSFRGVHDFSGRHSPQWLFQRFLHGAGARPLVMCHPGLVDARADDPLRDWRPFEYAYLAGPDFPRDLEQAGLQLGRLAR